MKAIFFSLLLTAVLVSCNTPENIKANLENDYRSYNEKLRWHKLDEAGHFPADSIADAYKERVKAAKNVAVVDYRVTDVKFDEKKKEAEVKVEIDYYKLNTLILRTVTDNQKWAYQGEKGKGHWRLMSLLPDFH